MGRTMRKMLVSALAATALLLGNTIPAMASQENEAVVAQPTTATTDVASTDEVSIPGVEEVAPAEKPASQTPAPQQPQAEEAEVTEVDSVSAPTETEIAQPAEGGTDQSTAVEETANDGRIAVTSGSANWDFRKSFRDYVGIEGEKLTDMTLLERGKNLLWNVAPGQKLDLTGATGKLKFTGKIEWSKYDGYLNLWIANPTIDFENKQLLADGYTRGTMAKAGVVEFVQQPIAQLADLSVTQKEGYVVVSSLEPVLTEHVKSLVGFYAGEKGAPFVATIGTSADNTAVPQPVLWEMFPERWSDPVNGPVYSDDPITNVEIPDANLEKCIRSQMDVDPKIPMTNKVLEGIQSINCAALDIQNLQGIEKAINLSSINLYKNKITDLGPLRDLTKLVSLSVGGNRLTSLAPLAKLTKLHSLSAEENWLTDVSVVKNLPNLSTLNLANNRISDITQLPMLEQNPDADTIEEVNLSHNRISDLSRWNELVFIKNVNLSHNLIEDLGTLPLKRGIRKLDLSNNFITDPSPLAAWKENATYITWIKLAYNSFGQDGWDALQPLTAITDEYQGTTRNLLRGGPNTRKTAKDLRNPQTKEAVQQAHVDEDAVIAAEIAQINEAIKAKRQAEEAKRQAEEEAKRQAEEDAKANQNKVSGSLSWGVKKSFRQYIHGFARGDWTLSDGATGEFDFPVKNDGKISADNLTELNFAGKVHFTAHHGLLDLAISEPTIKQESGAWKLYATLDSRPFDRDDVSKVFAGEKIPLADLESHRVAIADLSAPQKVVTGDAISLSFAEVNLTSAGATAFANFYPVGQELDPITVAVEITKVNMDTPGTDTPGTDTPGTDTPGTGDSTSTTEGVANIGTLDWGVKDSFRKYIHGFAKGDWELFDGVTGEFIFPLKAGEKVSLTDIAEINFAGRVHFTGHHGLLDLTISEPTVKKEADGWKLYATVASRPLDNQNVAMVTAFRSAQPASAITSSRVALATLSDPQKTIEGKATKLSFAHVALTAEGAQAFAGFYKVGQELDPLTIVLGAPAQSPNADNEKPSAPGENGTDVNPGSGNDQQAHPESNATQNQANTPAPIKKCEVDPNKKRITSGNLSWGIRSSFTTYVRGSIAHGGWDLNGASWNGSTFNFPATGGLYNTATRTGNIYYGGTVHFTGHDGILDLTMSNPSISINGNSGSLYMTVTGSDMSGKKFELGRVNFATVTFNGISVSDGALSFSGAAVSLTEQGAKAFAGFYKPGEALDSMSSQVTLVPATECDPVTGELIEYGAFGTALAKTGIETQGMLLGSVLLLFAGVGVLGARRRHVHLA